MVSEAPPGKSRTKAGTVTLGRTTDRLSRILDPLSISNLSSLAMETRAGHTRLCVALSFFLCWALQYPIRLQVGQWTRLAASSSTPHTAQ